ncbi:MULTISPECIES: hypothetical protein [unclassified Streptomyces]|uniref:hypothetical protein n=1 Tax=unclassified Streptomyces TaxID=2593676 RepID=UPI00093CEBD6|nr:MULTISPECIES: hypothetical protein [unclassified Streptomyces]MCX5416848.1 hypothetical protein [Streptomyces sp. NBC_00059]OKI98410.1 hypothetical protein AMK10_06370 [Streptomyces sp. CB02058]
MSSTPQIATQEISDADLDAVSGGLAGAASVEAPLVGGISGGLNADLLSGSVSGAVGANVLGVAGLGSAATLSV